MKIEKVLLLSDFNNISLPIINYALAFSHYFEAELTIMHVYDFSSNLGGEMYLTPEMITEHEQNIRDQFEKLKDFNPELNSSKIHFQLIRGEFIPALQEVVEQESIDFVIIGNRSKGLLTNILGSTANKVIHHCPCPVLTLPDEIEFKAFKKIAIAIDLEDTSKNTIHFLKNFATLFKARLDILHVSNAPIPVDVSQMIRKFDLALDTLQHQFFHIHSSEIEEAIEHHVQRNAIDLLMMMPRAHPYFDRLFQRSITRQASYHHNTPLLTIRQKE